jgi:hypothetical protein
VQAMIRMAPLKVRQGRISDQKTGTERQLYLLLQPLIRTHRLAAQGRERPPDSVRLNHEFSSGASVRGLRTIRKSDSRP